MLIQGETYPGSGGYPHQHSTHPASGYPHHHGIGGHHHGSDGHHYNHGGVNNPGHMMPHNYHNTTTAPFPSGNYGYKAPGSHTEFNRTSYESHNPMGGGTKMESSKYHEHSGHGSGHTNFNHGYGSSNNYPYGQNHGYKGEWINKGIDD